MVPAGGIHAPSGTCSIFFIYFTFLNVNLLINISLELVWY